jgi:heme/copper-type cytochrome/quinol oxidase subunit 2
MATQNRRHITERRKENRNVLSLLRKQVEEVHHRVFNGLGAEIRAEVRIEIDKLRGMLWALLSALFIALIAIVVTVLISSYGRSNENDRNYKAIVDIGSRLENHIIQTVPGVHR